MYGCCLSIKPSFPYFYSTSPVHPVSVLVRRYNNHWYVVTDCETGKTKIIARFVKVSKLLKCHRTGYENTTNKPNTNLFF